MKREFLEGLGLEKEAIDKIMDENGKDIENQKLATSKVSDELEGVKKQLEDANKAIKDFENLDVEGIKKAADDWEIKYKTDTENLRNRLIKRIMITLLNLILVILISLQILLKKP
ncbi:phage scaffolding protein [Eubacteriaceae bacterium ES2]|nr:phage scaffolding protein [Eubacteriaceae bacterium ES2]